MRNISVANQAALEAGRLVARDYMTIIAKHRVTGVLQEENVWSDLGTVTSEVVNPDTGADDQRDFVGSGTLIKIDDIPLTANLQVQSINIRFSQVSAKIDEVFRTYNAKQAVVQIFRGLFDPVTRLPIDAAECRFAGFVDQIDVETPAAGNTGAVTATCVSHTQEMSRSNPDTRSHESQHRREPTDNFYKDAGVAHEWEVFWGSQKGKPPTQKRKKFLGIF